MKKIWAACIVLAAGTFSAAAIGAPGEIWEVTSKMEMPGMPMAMPARTAKICIPKGSDDPSAQDKNTKCTRTDVKRTGKTVKFKGTCVSQGTTMKMSGESTHDSNSFHTKMNMKGESDGEAMDMSMESRGKRIGGACDTEDAVKEAKKTVDKQIAQSCDLSNRSSVEMIGMADMYLTKGSMCADKRKALCGAISKDAARDADTYDALISHDKHLMGSSVPVAKSCGINMAATTKSVCKTLNGKNYDKLSPYCPAEAKAWRVAERKRECAGRSYTPPDNIDNCIKGIAPASSGRSYTAGSESGSAGQKNQSPAGTAIEGAKKLKGLIGF